MGFLKKYFTLSGRLTPLQYWRFQVRLALAAAVIISLTAVATMAGGWLGALPLLFVIPLVVAGVCVGGRRLHDRGKSAWWLALFVLVPFALVAPANLLSRDASAVQLLGALIAALASLVITAWGWIEIGFLRGQKGPNRYDQRLERPRPSTSSG